MPALPDYPNVLKVRTHFTIGADADVSTTIHMKYSGTAPTDAVATLLATDIKGMADSNFAPVVGTANTINAVEVQDLTSATAGYGIFGTPTAGSRTGEALPAAVCVLDSLAIARRYRGGKPRNYWPWGTASDVLNPSAWTTDFVTDCNTAIAGFIDEATSLSEEGTVTGAWCSVSYYSGFTSVLNPITGRTRDIPTVRAVAIAPDEILSQVISPKPATQRRRAQQH